MIDYTTLTNEELLHARTAVEVESEQLREKKLAIKAEVLRREAAISASAKLAKMTPEERAALQGLAQGVGLESATIEAEAPIAG